MDVWLRRRSLLLLSAISALFVAGGCAEGPFNGGGTLNPWQRKEWEKDERRGPTFHAKMKTLRELAKAAPAMPANRQEEVARDMLERYRDESNPLLRAAVVRVVGNLNSPQVEETLKLAITDSDVEVRTAAVRALGKQGGEDALQLLATAMGNDSELDVRIAVASELKRFKNSPDATRALGLALDDNDAALQHQAIVSLQNVTGRNYGMSAPAWREYLAGGNPTPPPGPTVAQQVKEWVWW